MRLWTHLRGAWALTTVAAAALTASHASAQLFGHPRSCTIYPPPNCTTTTEPPTTTTPRPPDTGATTTPPSTDMVASAPSLPSLDAGVQGGRGVAFGSYIDSALINSMVRIRFDAAYNNNRPDRAEFFYAKCGCLRNAPGALRDPNAPGPPLTETNVDYQDIMGYIEYAFTPRVSAFVEVPVRFLNPDVNDNTTGLADMNAGVKVALISCPEQVLTFQLRTYFPTGDSDRGLGTDHVSIEPALLYWQQLSDRLYLQAEFRDWIPVDGTDFAGNVIRYGVGLGYYVVGHPQLPRDPAGSSGLAVAPTLEFVGWTVLDGKELDGQSGQVLDASGDTILNAKIGLRVDAGANNSIAVSYGRALTGAVWYKDIIRVEYRYAF